MADNEDLERAVAARIQEGWRIESQARTIATLVRGKRPSHILHLLLTLVTFGFWALVWMNVVAWGGERRLTLSLEPDGTLLETRQRPGPLKTWPPRKTVLG